MDSGNNMPFSAGQSVPSQTPLANQTSGFLALVWNVTEPMWSDSPASLGALIKNALNNVAWLKNLSKHGV